MTLTHAASRHVRTLFDSIREQFRIFQSGFASVVADYAQLEEAQRATDLLFTKSTNVRAYASLLKPVACTSLGELSIAVRAA